MHLVAKWAKASYQACLQGLSFKGESLRPSTNPMVIVEPLSLMLRKTLSHVVRLADIDEETAELEHRVNAR